MNSKEYEQLINNISQELTNDTRLRSIGRKQVGRNNLWEGASGFRHQIDVSIDSDSEALLIECKFWKSEVRAIEFLTHLGRLIDIRDNPKNKNRNIRGALVTSKMWQSGVEVLVRYYSEMCSVFVVNEESEVVTMIHTHFIRVPSIPSRAAFGQPSIKQSEPDV